MGLLTVQQKGYPMRSVRFYLKAKMPENSECSTMCSRRENKTIYKLALITQETVNAKFSGKETEEKFPSIFITSSPEKEISEKNISDFLNPLIPERKIKDELLRHIRFFFDK